MRPIQHGSLFRPAILVPEVLMQAADMTARLEAHYETSQAPMYVRKYPDQFRDIDMRMVRHVSRSIIRIPSNSAAESRNHQPLADHACHMVPGS